MSDDLIKAIDILNSGKYSCVLCKKCKIYTSAERGVKPLLEWLNSKTELEGFAAADKVVGKAAAFLYVMLGVREVYSHVMSESAVDTLERNGVQPYFDKSVKNIINRAGTGFCPMEEAVREIEDQDEALQAIKKRLAEL